jgi:type II secretory pathway pseudopilin PulG
MKISLHSQKKGGFSLIEMLVYVAILAFMLAVIIEVVLSVARSERVMKAVRSVENSAIVSLERISRELREAESVDTTLSTLGSHPGSLVLEGTDGEGNSVTTEFYLSQGRLMLRENGVESGALTETGATVTDLKFHYFSATTSAGVRTEITIESGTSTHYRTEKFYSTSVTR